MDTREILVPLGNDIYLNVFLSDERVNIVRQTQDSTQPDIIIVSLSMSEFKRLLSISSLLQSGLKQKIGRARNNDDYLLFIRYQTKYVIGKNVYVKIDHLGEIPELHFFEYEMVNSTTVRGETLVMPRRFLIALQLDQFKELLS